MSQFLATLLSNLIPILVTAIGSLITLAVTKLASANATKNKAEAAAIKVGQLGLTIAGNIWSKAGPEIQNRLADGKFDAEDRAAITKLVEQEIKAIDVSGSVSEVASALGLPLSGIIGTVAEWVINHFAKAHDESVPTVSSLAYPVSALPANAYAPSSAQAAR